MPSAHQQATPQGSIWHSPAATGRRRSMLPTGNLCSKASTAPGTPANLLQRLAASTQQDEDTYLLQKRYVYSLLSSLLCVAGSCLVFTWFPFCMQLTISDGPDAGNTAPAESARQMTKSAEKSRQPASLFGYSESVHTRPNARHLACDLEHTKQPNFILWQQKRSAAVMRQCCRL